MNDDTDYDEDYADDTQQTDWYDYYGHQQGDFL